jgi:hypothetical protein
MITRWSPRFCALKSILIQAGDILLLAKEVLQRCIAANQSVDSHAGHPYDCRFDITTTKVELVVMFPAKRNAHSGRNRNGALGSGTTPGDL